MRMQRLATLRGNAKAPIARRRGTEAKGYVFEVVTCAALATSVNTLPLAANKWNAKPTPLNGMFKDRGKQSRVSEQLLPCFFNGNESVRDGIPIMKDRKDKANPSWG